MLLNADPEALLVAEVDGVVVGSLIAAWDGWGELLQAGRVAGATARGLATMLLREGERRLCERGAIRLTAIVADADARAMAFWASCRLRTAER